MDATGHGKVIATGLPARVQIVLLTYITTFSYEVYFWVDPF